MGVGPEGEPRISVPEVLADGLDRLALMQSRAGVEVTQRVAAVLAFIWNAGAFKRWAQM